MAKSRPYKDALLESLKDPAEAAAYINAASEEGEHAFLVAIKNVIKANGATAMAKQMGVNRVSIYNSFSEDGNPKLSTLLAFASALGLRLTFEVETENQRGDTSRSRGVATG